MSDVVQGWRAWIDNDAGGWRQVNSRTHAWNTDVGDNVIVIMLYFDDGTRRIMQGADHYARIGDGSVGIVNWFQGTIKLTDADAVSKLGKLVSDSTFEAVVVEALAEMDPP